jgi:hypothetical protein
MDFRPPKLLVSSCGGVGVLSCLSLFSDRVFLDTNNGDGVAIPCERRHENDRSIIPLPNCFLFFANAAFLSFNSRNAFEFVNRTGRHGPIKS